MRSTENWNQNWEFWLCDSSWEELSAREAEWEPVHLPHTWNNLDGQDGGGDYHRGRGWYRKEFTLEKEELEQNRYLTFDGANHICDVYCNGHHIKRHEGGFSAFSVCLSHVVAEGKNHIVVCVDNSPGTHVYPQAADFTFFGGLYRSVHLICLGDSHFSMEEDGSTGVFVTPEISGDVHAEAYAVGREVTFTIKDGSGRVVAEHAAPVKEGKAVCDLQVAEVHRWHGRKDPYLYTLEACVDGMDVVEESFGFREFRVLPDQGFFLNGEYYPLRGVCRHQDRENMGWAITQKDHEEDAELIYEVGATAIRLAHYQHAKEFYRLCDEKGLILWAEIPFISVFDDSEAAVHNTMVQMRELVRQNYNHPSICFWGISNEISVGGESLALEKNLVALHTLTKELDPKRMTTIANMSMTPFDSRHNFITDIVAYNHYFGWYVGKVEDNGPWFDQYHAANPDRCLALSEYGAEAVMGWHSSTPKAGDYTEEYQAYYHEKMLETFESRPYLWGTFLWNMFDFAADARDEGGCKGRNNKGIVTFDRKVKKDSFYLYKAYWSDEKFVYLAGRRYVDRAEDKTTIKVYSNCPQVSLSVNGKEVAAKSGKYVFEFSGVDLLMGENKVLASSGEWKDEIIICRVTEANPDYVMPQEQENEEGVPNWFTDLLPEHKELRFPEGYYSIRDTIGELMSHPEAGKILQKFAFEPLMEQAKGADKEGGGGILKRASSVPFEAILPFIRKKLPKYTELIINEQLIKIRK